MAQIIYYVSNKKPRSHNQGGKQQSYKDDHKIRFTQKYAHLYSRLPIIDKNLYSKMTYIYHDLNKCNIPDIDNLSKPIVDAFSGVIYKDDSQIIKREATKLELNDLQFITIDYSGMPYEIANDLNDFIENQEQHIVLFSVKNIELKEIRIGEI